MQPVDDCQLVFEDVQLNRHIDELLNSSAIAHFTSLPSFDALLGGVNRGMITVIGAMPACGKTTLLTQLADDLAAQEIPVIFLSLELPACRIIQKSITRFGGGAFAANDIVEFAKPGAQSDLIVSAINCYRELIAPNIAILGATTIENLIKAVETCMMNRGIAPAILVDYLQLFATVAYPAINDDRAAISACVRDLRNLASTYGSPIYLTSTITRQSYSKPDVDLDVFGGAQAIEYGFDQALYMSVDGVKRTDVRANSTMLTRPVIMTTLKTRYSTPGSAHLCFQAPFSRFVDGQ